MKKYLVISGLVVAAIAVSLVIASIRVAKAPGTGGPTSATGVRGIVVLGPTCPVERMPPDPTCADKPYATAIVVYPSGSQTAYLIGNSDATGAFSLPLPPGSYTLAAGGGTTLPRCASVDVTIGEAGYATTTITCDTGIR